MHSYGNSGSVAVSVLRSRYARPGSNQMVGQTVRIICSLHSSWASHGIGPDTASKVMSRTNDDAIEAVRVIGRCLDLARAAMRYRLIETKLHTPALAQPTGNRADGFRGINADRSQGR